MKIFVSFFASLTLKSTLDLCKFFVLFAYGRHQSSTPTHVFSVSIYSAGSDGSCTVHGTLVVLSLHKSLQSIDTPSLKQEKRGKHRGRKTWSMATDGSSSPPHSPKPHGGRSYSARRLVLPPPPSVLTPVPKAEPLVTSPPEPVGEESSV